MRNRYTPLRRVARPLVASPAPRKEEESPMTLLILAALLLFCLALVALIAFLVQHVPG